MSGVGVVRREAVGGERRVTPVRVAQIGVLAYLGGGAVRGRSWRAFASCGCAAPVAAWAATGATRCGSFWRGCGWGNGGVAATLGRGWFSIH